MLKFLEYGFLVFAFLLPWQTRLILKQGEVNGAPWEYGTFSIYLTEALLWVILLITLVWALRTKFKIFDFRFQIFFPIVGLFFFSLISILWAPDKLVAFRSFLTLAEG